MIVARKPKVVDDGLEIGIVELAPSPMVVLDEHAFERLVEGEHPEAVVGAFVYATVPVGVDAHRSVTVVQGLMEGGARAVKLKRAPRPALVPERVVHGRCKVSRVRDVLVEMLDRANVEPTTRDAAKHAVDQALGEVGL